MTLTFVMTCLDSRIEEHSRIVYLTETYQRVELSFFCLVGCGAVSIYGYIGLGDEGGGGLHSRLTIKICISLGELSAASKHF
jgi:hypothetical protein